MQGESLHCGHQRLIDGQILHVKAGEDRVHQQLQTVIVQFCSKYIQDLNLEITFTVQAHDLRDMLPKEMRLNSTAVVVTNGHDTWPRSTASGNRGGTGGLFCWSFLSPTYLGSGARHIRGSNHRGICCALATKPLITMTSGVASSSTVLND